jgi:hypothetical protein
MSSHENFSVPVQPENEAEGCLSAMGRLVTALLKALEEALDKYSEGPRI